jgi:hypothetical protein
LNSAAAVIPDAGSLLVFTGNRHAKNHDSGVLPAHRVHGLAVLPAIFE